MADHEQVISEWPCDASGEFLIAGMPLERAVAIAGGTPCYLYDAPRIQARVTDLKASLPANVHLHYALKANPMPALAAMMARLVDGFDVASAGELQTAAETGMSATNISFAGPGKSLEDLTRGLALGVLFNVESFREARLLAELGEKLGVQPRVAVRCNLPFELKASGMKMTGGPKPFGIDADQVPQMLSTIKDYDLAFEGFHLFAGSQNLKAESVIEAQDQSFALAMLWRDQWPGELKSLNLGGGFGIPYTASDKPLEISPVLQNLNQLAEKLAETAPQARLVVELGRYLVGEAGLYVARILDRKLSHGHPFLVTDGGMHQHLAASGNFGQVIRRNYPVAINGKPGAETEKASVTGPLCTPLDVLADKAELAVAEEGDLVVVFQSGAYGRTASPREFLGHPEVKEALIWGDAPNG